MEISVTLPDHIAAHLGTKKGVIAQQFLESLAIEKYRSRQLSTHQVGQLLGHHSRWETDAFLKAHQCYGYTEEDLEQDRQNLDQLLAKLNP